MPERMLYSAADFAWEENRNAYIQAGWATGDYAEYYEWAQAHELPVDTARTILSLYGVDVNRPDAVADYGGGAECANFYDIPGAVIGITTTHCAWFARTDEKFPVVENYAEPEPSDDEN